MRLRMGCLDPIEKEGIVVLSVFNCQHLQFDALAAGDTLEAAEEALRDVERQFRGSNIYDFRMVRGNTIKFSCSKKSNEKKTDRGDKLRSSGTFRR